MHEKILHNRSIVFVTDFPGFSTAPSPAGISIDIDQRYLIATHIDDYALEEEGIAEKVWQRSGRPEKTPITTKIRYKNGISFNIEVNKLVFQNSDVRFNPDNHDFQSRAVKILNLITSKNLKLHSIGINFALIQPTAESEQYVLENYLQKSQLNIGKTINKAMLKLSYQFDQSSTCNLQIGSASKLEVQDYTYEPDTCVVYDINLDYYVKGHALDSLLNLIFMSDQKLKTVKDLLRL